MTISQSSLKQLTTNNKFSLKLPKIKLEIARPKFYFEGVLNILILSLE